MNDAAVANLVGVLALFRVLRMAFGSVKEFGLILFVLIIGLQLGHAACPRMV